MKRGFVVLIVFALSSCRAGPEPSYAIGEDLSRVIQLQRMPEVSPTVIWGLAREIDMSAVPASERERELKSRLALTGEAADVAREVEAKAEDSLVEAVVAALSAGMSRAEVVAVMQSTPKRARPMVLDRISALMVRGMPFEEAFATAVGEAQ